MSSERSQEVERSQSKKRDRLVPQGSFTTKQASKSISTKASDLNDIAESIKNLSKMQTLNAFFLKDAFEALSTDNELEVEKKVPVQEEVTARITYQQSFCLPSPPKPSEAQKSLVNIPVPKFIQFRGMNSSKELSPQTSQKSNIFKAGERGNTRLPKDDQSSPIFKLKVKQPKSQETIRSRSDKVKPKVKSLENLQEKTANNSFLGFFQRNLLSLGLFPADFFPKNNERKTVRESLSFGCMSPQDTPQDLDTSLQPSSLKTIKKKQKSFFQSLGESKAKGNTMEELNKEKQIKIKLQRTAYWLPGNNPEHSKTNRLIVQPKSISASSSSESENGPRRKSFYRSMATSKTATKPLESTNALAKFSVGNFKSKSKSLVFCKTSSGKTKSYESKNTGIL